MMAPLDTTVTAATPWRTAPAHSPTRTAGPRARWWRWARGGATVVGLALAVAPSPGCVSLRPFDEVAAALPAADFVTIDGLRLHVVDRGPRDGRPVVLLHGFGASAAMWRDVQPRLAERHRVIAIDLHGFGWSERPRRLEAYTLDGQADLVIAVLDALGLGRATIVGHSYGGGIAQWLAVRNGDRVEALALVDAASPVYATTRRSRLAAVRPFAGLFLRTVALRPRYVRRGLENAFHDDALVTAERVALYLEPLRVEGTSFAYRALSVPLPGQIETFDPSAIRQPTLVLWGEEDRLIAVDVARRIAGAIPGARLVTLPATGHVPPEERPEATAEALLEFLAASRPAGG